MRPSQKQHEFPAKQTDVDNTDDPKGTRSIKSASPRIREGRDDAEELSGAEGKPIPGGHDPARLAKADSRIAQVNKVTTEGSSDF